MIFYYIILSYKLPEKYFKYIYFSNIVNQIAVVTFISFDTHFVILFRVPLL